MRTPEELIWFKCQRDALLGKDRRREGIPGGVLGDLISTYDRLLEQDLPRKKTIVEMLQRLWEFARTHFDFFYDGFSDPNAVKLVESNVYPPEAALAAIISQLREDIEIIQRAANQRYKGSLGMQETLTQADHLAYRALAQAKKIVKDWHEPEEDNDHSTVLTYFQKAAEVRVIPYAPVALVGIPLSAFDEKRDLLAIPHEIGHYVFRHRQEEPQKALTEQEHKLIHDHPCQRWQEELFADVFGALVAGPVMAFDFQELEEKHDRWGFVNLQDKHPAPFLRPLIYGYVLERAGNAPLELRQRLEKRWRETLEARWGDALGEFLLKRNIQWAQGNALALARQALKTNGSLADMQDLHTQRVLEALKLLDVDPNQLRLDPAVTQLCELALAQLVKVQPEAWGDVLEMEKLAKANALELDKPFKDALQAGGLKAPPDLVPTRDNERWIKWTRDEKFFDGDSPFDRDKIDSVKDEMVEVQTLITPVEPKPLSGATGMGGVAPEPSWLSLWYARGWTTEPPQANPPGG